MLVLGTFFPSLLMIPNQNLRLVVVFVFCFTFVLPAVNILMFRYFGNIVSWQMPTREERIMPFIFMSLTYGLVAFLFFYKLPFSDNFNKLMVVITLLVLSAAIATFFIKVSVHSLAMAGMVGVLLPLNLLGDGALLLWPLAATMTLCGVVMSARLYLAAHTPSEVYWGGAVGFLVSCVSVFVLY